MDITLIEQYKNIMNAIGAFILCNVTLTAVRNKNYGTLHNRLKVRNTSRAGGGVVINYFSQFPMFSSKWLDFLNYREVHALVNGRQAKTPEGVKRVAELKGDHNSTRTTFTWGHLNKFYTR